MVKQHISAKFKGTAYGFVENSIRLSWNKFKLGDIGTFYSGLTGKSKKDFGTGSAKYITFLNVLCNPVIDTKILESVRISKNETQNLVAKGDLFFNTSSEIPEEVGMCAALTEDSENTYLNSFCFGFRITNPEIDPLYLSYYFNSQEGRKIMRVLAQGATRYNLSKSNFSDIVILTPKRDEQIEIASALSDIYNLIVNLEKLIEKKKAIKQGTMQELLTGKRRLNGFKSKWSNILFEETYNYAKEGGTPSTSNALFYLKGNIPFVKIEDLGNKYIDSGRVYITEEGIAHSSAWLIPPYSVILSNGATIGEVSINKIPITTKQGILGIIPSDKITAEYLYYYFSSYQFREALKKITTHGTMDCAYLKDINAIDLYVPTDINEQDAITKFLSDIDSEIEELENKLEKYKKIKIGMMSELFTGRIRLISKEEE